MKVAGTLNRETTGVDAFQDGGQPYIDFSNTAPGLPGSGTARVFRADVGGREMIRVVGDDGDFATMQPHLGRNNFHCLIPTFGSGQFNAIGFPTPTTIGSGTTVRTWASTSRFTRTRRLGFTSAATAGTSNGFYTTIALCSTGDTSTGSGGFHYIVRFGVADTLTSARMFIGLSDSASAPSNVEITTLTNMLGVGKLSTSSNLCVYGAGSSAQSATDLGSNFPSATSNTDLYEFIMFAASSTSPVTWLLTRFLSNGTSLTASGTLGSAGAASPASTVGLGLRAYRTATTAAAVSFDIAGLYMETDI